MNFFIAKLLQSQSWKSFSILWSLFQWMANEWLWIMESKSTDHFLSNHQTFVILEMLKSARLVAKWTFQLQQWSMILVSKQATVKQREMFQTMIFRWKVCVRNKLCSSWVNLLSKLISCRKLMKLKGIVHIHSKSHFLHKPRFASFNKKTITNCCILTTTCFFAEMKHNWMCQRIQLWLHSAGLNAFWCWVPCARTDRSSRLYFLKKKFHHWFHAVMKNWRSQRWLRSNYLMPAKRGTAMLTHGSC